MSVTIMPCCQTILRLEVRHPRRLLGDLSGEVFQAEKGKGFIVKFSSRHALETATLESDKSMRFCPSCGKKVRPPVRDHAKAEKGVGCKPASP